MYQKIVFLAALLIGIQFAGSAQNLGEILLMSGKTIEGNILSVDSVVAYEHVKKNGSTKMRYIDSYRIFSVTDSTGEEQIIYEQDTLVGNDFSAEEMRYYVYGEQDAMAGYKVPHLIVSSFILSGVGGYYLSDNFVIFAVPFFSVVLTGTPRPKIQTKSVRDPKYLSEPAYVLGYERTAKSKKILLAIPASLLGVISGAAVYNLTK